MKTVKTFALFFVFFNFLTIAVHSQAPTIQWQKSFGGSNIDQANCVKQTNDGGYIIGGYTASNDGDVTGNHGDWDYWIVKINSTGDLQWQKCFGGSSIDFVCYKIEQTIDGGYLAIGWTRSNNGDVIGNHGGDDFWVLKLSSSGNIEWQRTIGGSSNDYCTSFQQTTDGGYILTGEAYSTDGDVIGNHGDYDYLVVKLSSTGSTEWRKVYGGSGREEPMSVIQTVDGGYMVAGGSTSTNGDVTGNHGYFDYWLLKLDPNGLKQWQKSYGGSGSDSAMGVYQTADGGYIVSGSSSSNDGDVTENHGLQDYWILKITSTGTITWQKSLGGSAPDVATFGGQQTLNGEYVCAGWSYSNNGDVSGNNGIVDYWIVKLSSTGALKWQKCLGGTNKDVCSSFQETLDGGFVLAGVTQSINGDVTANHGNGDFWIVKLNPEQILPLNLITFTAGLENDATSLVWQTQDEYNISSFIIQRSNDLNHFVDIKQVNAKGSINNIYAALDEKPVEGKNHYRLKIIDKNGSITYSRIALVELIRKQAASLSPNPVNNVLNITFFNQKTEKKTIQLINMDGKVLKTYKVQSEVGTHSYSVNTGFLITGSYYLKLTGEQTKLIRFIKQ